MAYESMIFVSLMFDLIHEEIIADLQAEKRKKKKNFYQMKD